MLNYVARRLLDSVVVVFLALSVVFLMMWLSGDPVKLMAPLDASPEMLEQVRDRLGLNDPIYVQYARYIGRAVQGDFGVSLRQSVPAMPLVIQYLPNTLLLGATAAVLAILLGIPLGVYSAIFQGTWFDRLATILASLGQAIPNFWLGLMLVIVFAVQLRVLPTSGMGTWKHLIMPSVTLAAYTLARITRLTRSSVLEVLSEQFVSTARAKGLAERSIVWKHVVRNAMVPIITIIGLQIGGLVGGAVITETIFAWPGLGRLVVQSLQFRDFPVVMAAVFFIAVFLSLLNLAIDLIYVAIDPRIEMW